MSNKKQRFISTSFWDDPWVQSLTPINRYLYLYLLTNTLTNIAGVYEISTRRIAFDTGLTKPVIEKTLSMFSKDRKAVRVQEYIILPAWPNHQKWDKSPRIKQGINNILKTIPEHIIKCMVFVEYRYPIDTVYSGDNNSEYPLSYLDLDSDFDMDTYTNTFSQNAKKPICSSSEEKPELELPYSSPEFLEAWAGLMEVRKQKKAVNSNTAIKLVIAKLQKIAPSESEAIRQINRAIENSWKTVYPDNDFGNKNNRDPEADREKEKTKAEAEGIRMAKVLQRQGVRLPNMKLEG